MRCRTGARRACSSSRSQLPQLYICNVLVLVQCPCPPPPPPPPPHPGLNCPSYILNGNRVSGNLSFSVSRPLSKAGGTKLPSGNKTILCKSRTCCVNHALYSLPNLHQLQSSQEVLYEGDQCLLAPSPPPLLIPASSVTPVTPPFSLDSLCPLTSQNTAQVPKGKLSPAEVKS